ncbi:hypothetical protein H5410_015991 [Solanum commersonii]|uniref:Uncharacterized protein n=1 Tax=Solanum commersonii TaxID=4109 RepID=A0A9J5ZW88_SOLCO|nr:hypothetical protein H5410_015991 [Solanum commersonii]
MQNGASLSKQPGTSEGESSTEVQDGLSAKGEEPSTRVQRKLDLVEEPNKKWTTLFDNNRLSARGMNLSYVAPVEKNGEKVIELNKEQIQKATKEWKKSLILYVVGEPPTIAAVERNIATQGSIVQQHG